MNRSVDSPPPDLLRLFEPIRADLQRVEDAYAEHLQSRVDVIPRIGRYIQSSGGKRVRPAVLLMASRLCGYAGDRAILHAAVVEFIHTATLVHDDIIDDAEVRRGRLAAHSQWGNDVTVLLGDFLYIKSMSLALTENSLDLVRLLCDVTLRMIEGELYQLTKNGDIDITEDEHFDIIRRKTAHLFAGCAEIGGRLGTSTPEQWQALREYGFNLGIAFQLMDDLLDFTGDAEALGKPVGGDLREGKVTLPLIRLLASDPTAPPPHRADRRRSDRHARAMGRGDAAASAHRRARVRPDAGPATTPWSRGASWASFRPVPNARPSRRSPTTCCTGTDRARTSGLAPA